MDYEDVYGMDYGDVMILYLYWLNSLIVKRYMTMIFSLIYVFINFENINNNNKVFWVKLVFWGKCGKASAEEEHEIN